MKDATRKLLTDVARQLRADATILAAAITNLRIRGTTRGLSESVRIYQVSDRDAYREISEATHRSSPDRRGDNYADDTTVASETAQPIDTSDDRRRYTKKEYISIWESKKGRPMSPEEIHTLDGGCSGITALELGMIGRSLPTNLAFGNRRSHETIISAEEILAPIEIADAKAKHFRAELERLEKAAQKHYGPGWETNPTTPKTERDKIDHHRRIFEAARVDADQLRSTTTREDLESLSAIRTAAKLEGNKLTFERVSAYVTELKSILAAEPDNIADFAKITKERLPELSDVDIDLPYGKPSDWEVRIFAKQFWSGQSTPSGAYTHNPGHGNARPDSTLFQPNSTSGQVDMSADLHKAKPGFADFDYAAYDETTATWWHANHRELNDPERPLLAYQSSTDRFFAGTPDHDSAVICIAFVRK